MTSIEIGIIVFFSIIIIMIVWWFIVVYNGLVALKKQVERAWANIDVILKQRHDVIPQLISVCEQFAQYERRTLDHVISARQHYLSAGSRDQKIKADQEMSQVLRGVFAIGEAYPNLKSSDQFVQIQTTIANLENQLADRRELYNDSVTNFNTRILQFPDLLLAGRLGYNSESLYSVPEEDKKVPQLKLTLP